MAVPADNSLDRLNRLHGQFKNYASQFQNDPTKVDQERVDLAINELAKVIITPPHQFRSNVADQSKSARTQLRQISAYLRLLDPIKFKEMQADIGRLSQSIYQLPRDFAHFREKLEVHHRSVKAGLTDKKIKEIGRFLRDGFCFIRGTNIDGSPLSKEQKEEIENQLKALKEDLSLAPRDNAKETKNLDNLSNLIDQIFSMDFRTSKAVIRPPLMSLTASLLRDRDSIDTVREIMRYDPIRKYQTLADWISNNEIPLKDLEYLGVTQEEIEGIVPHLKYVDLRDYPLPNTDADVQQFICRFQKARELIIWSGALTRLPLLPELQRLNCYNCPRLESLPTGMNRLLYLYSTYCPRLTSLPTDMYRLKYFNCGNCPLLASLPMNMDSLETLYCDSCPLLTSLPMGMNRLIFLNCIACGLLASLPTDMNRLDTLFCDHCPLLTSLPTGMNRLLLLSCSNCLLLKSLPTDMNSLQHLTCTKCPLLASLPMGMNRLLTLRCSDCPLLASLPTGMNNLRRLSCERCPLLCERYPLLKDLLLDLPANVEIKR